jgi:hypothetical protein
MFVQVSDNAFVRLEAISAITFGPGANGEVARLIVPDDTVRVTEPYLEKLLVLLGIH